MPFIDLDKKHEEVTVETPFLWELKDKSLGGSLVVRGDGSVVVEVAGETGNSGSLSSEASKKFALLILEKQGVELENRAERHTGQIGQREEGKK